MSVQENISTTSGSPDNIIFNVVNSTTFTVMVPTHGWEGVLVAQNSTVTIDGSWNGEVIAGGNGNEVTLMSNITLNNTTNTAFTPTPEPASALLIGPLLVAGVFAPRRLSATRNERLFAIGHQIPA